MGSEQYIYFGNKMRSHVKAIGTCSLVLNSSFILNLEKTFYILNFSKNLISVLKFIPFGYSIIFLNLSFSLYFKSDIIGNDILSDGLIA